MAVTADPYAGAGDRVYRLLPTSAALPKRPIIPPSAPNSVDSRPHRDTLIGVLGPRPDEGGEAFAVRPPLTVDRATDSEHHAGAGHTERPLINATASIYLR